MQPSPEFYLAAPQMLDRVLRTAELLAASLLCARQTKTTQLSFCQSNTNSLVTHYNLSMKNMTIQIQSFGKGWSCLQPKSVWKAAEEKDHNGLLRRPSSSIVLSWDASTLSTDGLPATKFGWHRNLSKFLQVKPGLKLKINVTAEMKEFVKWIEVFFCFLW